MKSKQKIKYFGLALVTSFLIFSGGCSLFGAGNLDASTTAVYKNSEGLALEGFDPVAYFKENLPRMGNPEFTADYDGAKWQFVSAENREEFKKEPAKYAPQYGGYCAWAVGHNYTAKGDPNAWKIVDDKLYLNYNQDVREKWQQEIPKYVSEGDKNWQVLAGKAEDARKDLVEVAVMVSEIELVADFGR